MFLAHIILSTANPKKQPIYFLIVLVKVSRKALGPISVISHTSTVDRGMKDKLAKPGHPGPLWNGGIGFVESAQRKMLPERRAEGKLTGRSASQTHNFFITGWFF